MKRMFPLIICLFITVHSFGQKYTISGFVQDKATGEMLIGASVYDANAAVGAITNEYGYFSLTLPKGDVLLAVSYVGYTTFSEEIALDRNMEYIIDLEPNLQIEEVTITSGGPGETVRNSQMSSVQLSPGQIKAMPSFLGESDVLKALQLMPGVQSGTEGTSGMYVRGGGPDQNLILLDGVPIYNADHLFGFFSVFNPDAISNVTLIKGGFPAHFGGRLSSVIDIRLKEGNLKEFRGSGSIGLISSRVMLEGPIIKDKTSFLISARRTYADVLARPIIRIVNNQTGNKGMAGYYFYDANLKVNHRFSSKDRIFLSAYSGRDKLMIKDEYEYMYNDTIQTEKTDYGLYWGNLTSVLRWNHTYGNKFFSNLSVIYSNYKFDVYETYESLKNNKSISKYQFDYFTGIEDVGAILDFDYHPGPRNSIKFGGKYLYHRFKPGVLAYKATEVLDSLDLQFGNEIIDGQEFYIYAEDKMNIGNRLLINLGLHYSAFMVQDEYYHSLQPRVSARYLITDNLSLKAAITQMQQYIHLLTNATIGLPTDLWLPTTSKIPPEESWQGALGLAYNLKNEWTFTVEGFYKNMTNLIEYKEGSSFLQIETDWEDKVEIGDGWAYGVEFFARKDAGNLTGWIGYTLAWSNRQFFALNDGNIFPYTYDRRHDISVVGMYKFNENTDISATWVYGTGKAVTLGVARYAPDHWADQSREFYYSQWDEIEYYNGKNGFREPAYHRFDFSLNRHKKRAWGEQTWSFGAYNVYNRQNPFYLYFGHDNNGKRQLRQVSIFPIIPSVSYSFNF
ncbi:MAG: carboxypeptidase-like regulatory domain-containing protein [Bacteroidales bacterium]